MEKWTRNKFEIIFGFFLPLPKRLHNEQGVIECDESWAMSMAWCDEGAVKKYLSSHAA